MFNVFEKKRANEIEVQLSDGRRVILEDLIKEYESLSKEKNIIKLKVAEWFLINREVINKNKKEIRRKCYEAGPKGKALWERFEKSNKIADENPEDYPYLIETFILEYSEEEKTVQEMRDICEEIGDGMCCEVICDLELEMRICNGEQVDDLVKRYDTLPYERMIKFRNGNTGFFGGGDEDECDDGTPARLYEFKMELTSSYIGVVPYAFRKKEVIV